MASFSLILWLAATMSASVLAQESGTLRVPGEGGVSMTWNVSGATLEGTHTQDQPNLYGGGGQFRPGSTITVWGTVRNNHAVDVQAPNAAVNATIGYLLPGTRVPERVDVRQTDIPPGGSYDYRVSLAIPADAQSATIRVNGGTSPGNYVNLSFDLLPPQAKPKPTVDPAAPIPDSSAPVSTPQTPAPAPAPSAPKEPAQVDAMTLQAGVRRAQPGETVTVPIWLIRGQNVASMNVNLRYDPAVATAGESVTKGNLLGAALFEANPRESGLIRFGYAQSRDMGGTGTIAQIPFRAVGKPGDRTPLRLEVTTISSAAGATPAIATIVGEIVIVGKDGVMPGDSIVISEPTALRAGSETLASLAPGTHLVVGKVNPPWLAVTLEEDGKTVAGWISISAVSHVVTNSIGMKLVPIPSGEFMMGSAVSAEDLAQEFKDQEGPSPGHFEDEHPRHRVRITRPFHLGVHEVTVGQFRQFIEESGYRTDAEKGTEFEGAFGFDPETGEPTESKEYSWRNIGIEQSDEHPVVNVSWNDAVAFCKWLSRKENKLYRLPTEAEWEYACRAGTTTRYYHGDDPEGLGAVANVADATAKAKFPDWDWTITAEDGYVFAAPVGKFKPNAFGLHDMHGNVYEWCADWYGEDYYAQSPGDDPPGPAEGFDRVYRGGSWASSAGSCRAACRRMDEPAGRSLVLGFRVALVSAE